MRLHELILFSVLDTGAKREEVEKAYRLVVKRRYYVKCVRDYLALFRGSEILSSQAKGGLKHPYIYCSSMIESGDAFCGSQKIGGAEESKGQEESGQEDKMTSEGMKI